MNIPEEKLFEIIGRIQVENNILIAEVIKLQNQITELKKPVTLPPQTTGTTE